MSILIAYKRNGVVYMGTDTRIILGDTKYNDLCESNYKIQKLSNGMLVGFVGGNLERQTILANSDIFTLDKKGDLTRKHIVQEIIPALMGVLDDADLLKTDEDVPYVKGAILLAHKGTLYEICTSFTVIRYEDYQVLGMASEFALATIATMKETDDIHERMLKALKAADKNNASVGAPFLLIDTNELEYKIVEGD